MTCCERWTRETSTVTGAGPAALSYGGLGAQAQVVPDNEGTFAVAGCCMNCYVLDGLKFCPWCGAAKVDQEFAAATQYAALARKLDEWTPRAVKVGSMSALWDTIFDAREILAGRRDKARLHINELLRIG